MKKRILFVDDEAAVLTALELSLRKERKRWDMEFVVSGHEALARLQTQQYDIVISDMRMPVMNGAQLLGRVMREFPATVRLMLTGDADPKTLAESQNAIQEVMYKPCDTRLLRTAIERWLETGSGTAAVGSPPIGDGRSTQSSWPPPTSSATSRPASEH